MQNKTILVTNSKINTEMLVASGDPMDPATIDIFTKKKYIIFCKEPILSMGYRNQKSGQEIFL